jgi:hypothetical protein
VPVSARTSPIDDRDARYASVVPWSSVDRRALAWLRCSVGFAATAKALFLGATLPDMLTTGPHLPALGGFGLGRWLPVDAVPILLLGLGVFGVMLVTGVNARVSASAVAASGTLILLVDARTWSNHLLLLALLAAFVAGSDGGRWRGGPGRVVAPTALLACTQVSVVYVFAGLSKLTPEFLDGSVLAAEFAAGPLGALTHDLHPSTWAGLSLLAATWEIALGLALWSTRWRRWAVLAGVAFHICVTVAIAPWPELLVFAVLCCGAYPLFLTRAALPHPRCGARSDATAVASPHGRRSAGSQMTSGSAHSSTS